MDILFEPGRSLVGNVGVLCAKVIRRVVNGMKPIKNYVFVPTTFQTVFRKAPYLTTCYW